MTSQVADDSVNHPSHYTQYKGLEIIDLTEQMNFNRGNAVKYITRAGFKNPDSEIEDLEKSRWYISREIARLKKLKLDENINDKMNRFARSINDSGIPVPTHIDVDTGKVQYKENQDG